MSTWVRWLLLCSSLLLLIACDQLAGGNDASPAPRIIAITIPESIPGKAVMPSADVVGDIATWEWEFGTGATCDETDVPAPSITLGPTGSYSGSLTIADYRGRSATASFDYRVLKLAPPTVAGITPTGEVGHDHAEATFSAEVTGEVTSWSWDFGTGASPSTSSASQPIVTLQDPGTYAGTLEVCGAGGCTTTSFDYSIRLPVLSWSMTPFQADIWRCVLLTAADGRLVLVFRDFADLDDDDDFSNLWIATATPTDSPEALNWTRRQVTESRGWWAGLDAVIDQDRVIVCGSSESESGNKPELFFVPLDGGPVTISPLPQLATGSSSYIDPQMMISGSRLFLTNGSGAGFVYRTALLTTRLNGIPGVGDWTAFDLSAGSQYRPEVVDLIDLQGSIFMTHARPEGDQARYAGTVAAGRLHGNPDDGASAWTFVDIDRGARACELVRFTPTVTGLHLLYESYQDLGSEWNGYSYSSVPRNPEMRHAWTSDRSFNSTADWESGFFNEIQPVSDVQMITLRERPLLVGSVALDEVSHSTLSLGRGFSTSGSAIPWLTTNAISGGRIFESLSVTTNQDAAWVAIVEYQDSYYPYPGNHGAGPSYETPSDPILMIGKVTLE